jgi:hypothetical protein
VSRSSNQGHACPSWDGSSASRIPSLSRRSGRRFSYTTLAHSKNLGTTMRRPEMTRRRQNAPCPSYSQRIRTGEADSRDVRPGGRGLHSKRSAVPVETSRSGRWLGETIGHGGRIFRGSERTRRIGDQGGAGTAILYDQFSWENPRRNRADRPRFLRPISRRCVGKRPNRYETSAVKRRSRSRRLSQVPPAEARQISLGHVWKSERFCKI